MYNEELKLKFLQAGCIDGMRTNYNALFNDSSKFENKNDKDLSEFSNEEILDFVNSLSLINPQSARDVLSEINRYSKWVSGKTHQVRKEDIDFLTAIKNSIYADSQSLLCELKTSIEFDQGFFVVPAICLVWLGVDPSEIGYLPKANVDLNKGIIKDLNGNIVVNDMPEEIKSVLTTFATTYVGIRTQNRTFEVHPKDEGQFLYRMVTKNSNKTFKPITRKNISVEVVILRDRIMANTGSNKLSIYNVEKSGILNRVYQLEKSGVDVFSTAAREQVQALFKNRSDIFDNLFLYRKYKEAFNLQ